MNIRPKKDQSQLNYIFTLAMVLAPLIAIIAVAFASLYADKILTMTFNARGVCLIDSSVSLPHKICALQGRGM